MRRRRLIGLGALAVAAALALTACSSGRQQGAVQQSPPGQTASTPGDAGAATASPPLVSGPADPSAGRPAGSPSGADASTAPTATSASPTPSAPPATASAPVHVSLLQGDGRSYGVGMPIVAYVNRKITDAAAFDEATTVTVNGTPAQGAWHWQRSARPGQALEAHYRLADYWPAHARISLRLPVKGLSAGPGLAFENDLTLSITTGAAHVSSVDCQTERMTVTADGKTVKTFPVSCGKADTPTFSGPKVVMQKGEDAPGTNTLRPDGAVRMTSDDPADPYDLIVPWSVRLTNSGEFAHAAAWNGGNIGSRSTSHGCTNLNVDDAKWFYQFSQVGDVVTYTNTGAGPMPVWDGFGDWTLPWPVWQNGGLLQP